MAVGGGLGTLIIALIAYFLSGDPNALKQVVQQQGQGQGQAEQGGNPPPLDDELAKFVRVVLASTEDVWVKILPAATGTAYVTPKLVLFSGSVKSACGFANAAVGPFYCPADQKVYIDLSFYDDLRKRHKAPGDFAQAYVIAHEIGHHVQNLLGYSDRVHRTRGTPSHNEMSVRLELQADYLAGVWAHHAERNTRILERGDVAEALTAAAAIGDDRLQMEAQGYVSPESFTHGSSEQRERWFRRGLETGDLGILPQFFDPRFPL